MEYIIQNELNAGLKSCCLLRGKIYEYFYYSNILNIELI